MKRQHQTLCKRPGKGVRWDLKSDSVDDRAERKKKIHAANKSRNWELCSSKGAALSMNAKVHRRKKKVVSEMRKAVALKQLGKKKTQILPC